MKLLFSEHKSDYDHYIFPYAIWAFPEHDETPSRIFERGFLPSTLSLNRFYMCRQIRIRLTHFQRSSENRRIIKKGEGISYKLLPILQFEFTKKRKEFCKSYCDLSFGKYVMSYQRLDRIFTSELVTHVLVYNDTSTENEIGFVSLYLEPKVLAFYYYSFYDLNYKSKNLGMYMMTTAVDYFSQQAYESIYLGSCYSKNALYKTQFRGVEFFNGFRWSNNLEELKYLIDRDSGQVSCHLLESEEYLNRFYDQQVNVMSNHFGFTT